MTTRRRAPRAPTIIRSPKDRHNPYAQISRAPLEDARLTWAARGLLAYLLAKPDDWRINLEDLVAASPGGRDLAYRLIHELEAYGYIQRRTSRHHGRFTAVGYTVHEQPPLPANPDTATPPPLPDSPHPAPPHPAQPDTAPPFPAQPHPATPEPSTPTEPPPPLPASPVPANPTQLITNSTNNEKEGTKDEEGIVGAAPTPPPTDWQLLINRIAWCSHRHADLDALTEPQRGQLLAEAARIRDAGYTAHHVSEWWREVWLRDWRWRKGNQRPTPAQIRSSLPALRPTPPPTPAPPPDSPPAPQPDPQPDPQPAPPISEPPPPVHPPDPWAALCAEYAAQRPGHHLNAILAASRLTAVGEVNNVPAYEIRPPDRDAQAYLNPNILNRLRRDLTSIVGHPVLIEIAHPQEPAS